jgi:ATP-binding cassette subfamily B protein
MATILLFRREQVNYARFDAINADHRDAGIEEISITRSSCPPSSSWQRSRQRSFCGSGRVRDGWLAHTRSLVAFILYAGRFFRPISDMSEKFNTLRAVASSDESFSCWIRRR